ncbi:MAG: DUF2279 domain-containing protein [Ignavibacteriaceae bacterium]|jgi:hypothetical protein|nr:DUF2279 domain-containing protein [Ignavibacteriaceae bacterium]
MILLCVLKVYSQEADSSEGIKWGRFAVAGTALAAVDAGVWFYAKEAWYKYGTVKWHTFNDWYNAKLNLDKTGHAHMTMLYNKLIYHTARWTNMGEKEANWSSAGIAWLMQFQIELYDAYFENWGFSWPDVGANTIGAFYPTLQREFPLLQNFNLKYSYHPSSDLEQKFVNDFINDYEGTTYWLTINVHEFLPEAIKEYYPDWLNIALGYGVNGIFHSDGNWNHDVKNNKRGLGREEWYIALDYDFMKVFKPKEGTFWYTLLDLLNAVHLPAPTIRFSPSAIYYGLYF